MILSFDPALAHAGARIDRMELREPLVRQVIAAEKAGNAETGFHARHVRDQALVAQVAGVDLGVVKQMPMPVFREAERFVNGFSKTPKKGDPPPPSEAELLIELASPIEKMNHRLDVLELRPPLAGEMETAQRELGVSPDDERLRRFQLVLVALVVGKPRAVVEDLPISKLDEASRYLMGFT